MISPIVIRARVTQVGEDDEHWPAVWFDSGEGGYHKVHVSRQQCAQLSTYLYGEELELVIRPIGGAS